MSLERMLEEAENPPNQIEFDGMRWTWSRTKPPDPEGFRTVSSEGDDLTIFSGQCPTVNGQIVNIPARNPMQFFEKAARDSAALKEIRTARSSKKRKA